MSIQTDYDQLRELKEWKRQQMLVWDKVDEHIRNHPEVQIGQSISDIALKFLKEREELRAYKEEIENSFKFVMDERCSKNEVHCTCVPFLKSKIKELQKNNSFLETDNKRLASQGHVTSRKITNKNEIIIGLQKQIAAQEEEIKGWQNKWECAIGMAAIAENKLADIKKCL